MAKKDGKGKGKGGKGAAGGPQQIQPSVSAHPRAKRSITRAKAWGGLLVFASVALLSHRAGVTPFEVGVRALVAGIAAYLVVWFLAVLLWQRLVVHELKQEQERKQAELEARLAAQAEEVEGEEVVA
jgi:type VI protein secretion system component VasK